MSSSIYVSPFIFVYNVFNSIYHSINSEFISVITVFWQPLYIKLSNVTRIKMYSNKIYFFKTNGVLKFDWKINFMVNIQPFSSEGNLLKLKINVY